MFKTMRCLVAASFVSLTVSCSPAIADNQFKSETQKGVCKKVEDFAKTVKSSQLNGASHDALLGAAMTVKNFGGYTQSAKSIIGWAYDLDSSLYKHEDHYKEKYGEQFIIDAFGEMFYDYCLDNFDSMIYGIQQ